MTGWNPAAVAGLFALCMAAGYLLGSINWAIILTRIVQRKDIRAEGSGNAGMTNVLRSVGKLPALLTFVGDFLKNVAAVELAGFLVSCCASLLSQDHVDVEMVQAARYLAGAACVVGHIFPVYFGFRGGKGIVAAAAMIALVDWRAFLLVIATFLLVFIWKRIVSLASIVCAVLYPVYAFCVVFFFDFRTGGRSLGYLLFVTGVSLFIGLLVLVKHRANIGRLRRGEEKPVSIRKR